MVTTLAVIYLALLVAHLVAVALMRQSPSARLLVAWTSVCGLAVGAALSVVVIAS